MPVLKPKFGPSRSGESKDAQSASGSRGDQPAITSWMVQPKPSGDVQNDRKRGASQSDVARQTPFLPSLTLHNPGNHCYLNSIVQALYWIYFAVPSDRNSVFGDLRPLLRPLLSAKGRVQLLRRSAWRGLLQGWANVRRRSLSLTYELMRLRTNTCLDSWMRRMAQTTGRQPGAAHRPLARGMKRPSSTAGTLFSRVHS